MKRITLILLLCTISTIAFCQETTDVPSVPQGKSLNDIRFGGWTQKEWLDNEYIRTIRKRLDAYHKGEIKDANLDQHKAYINQKEAEITLCLLNFYIATIAMAGFAIDNCILLTLGAFALPSSLLFCGTRISFMETLNKRLSA